MLQINKEINVGEIASIITMLVVGGGFLIGVYTDLDKRIDRHTTRITVNERNIEVLKDSLIRIEDRNSERFKMIQGQLVRIEQKLDGKADK